MLVAQREHSILKERKGRLSLSLRLRYWLVFAFLEYARKDRKLKLQAKISGGHHGDGLAKNRNILYDGGKTNFALLWGCHGGLSFHVPPGTSGRLRSVDVRTGQYGFDFQIPPAMEAPRVLHTFDNVYRIQKSDRGDSTSTFVAV